MRWSLWLALLLAADVTCGELAITNARVITMGDDGVIESGSVLVRDGRIAAVGPDLVVPAGVEVLDANGRILTPGLVMAATTLGLKDLPGGGHTGLTSSSARASAVFAVADDFNPDNPQVAEARVEGATHAVLVPGPGTKHLISGQVAVVHLSDEGEVLQKELAAIEMAGGEMGASVAGGSRSMYQLRFRQLIAATRSFIETGKVDPEASATLSLSRDDLQVLATAIDQGSPFLVAADRASDIVMMAELSVELGVPLVLVGAAEGWMVADRIAAAGVSVILDGDLNAAALTAETRNATYFNAAKLYEAGVRIAFRPATARPFWHVRTPRFIAGRAVRYGLPWMAALSAITVNPAHIFRFDDTSGSIEVGKDADLVLWEGDPLETDSVALAVIIKGIRQPSVTRSSLLRDRYLPDLQETP